MLVRAGNESHRETAAGRQLAVTVLFLRGGGIMSPGDAAVATGETKTDEPWALFKMICIDLKRQTFINKSDFEMKQSSMTKRVLISKLDQTNPADEILDVL